MLSEFNLFKSHSIGHYAEILWIWALNGLPNLLHEVIYNAFTAFKHIHADLWAIEK